MGKSIMGSKNKVKKSSFTELYLINKEMYDKIDKKSKKTNEKNISFAPNNLYQYYSTPRSTPIAIHEFIQTIHNQTLGDNINNEIMNEDYDNNLMDFDHHVDRNWDENINSSENINMQENINRNNHLNDNLNETINETPHITPHENLNRSVNENINDNIQVVDENQTINQNQPSDHGIPQSIQNRIQPINFPSSSNASDNVVPHLPRTTKYRQYHNRKTRPSNNIQTLQSTYRKALEKQRNILRDILLKNKRKQNETQTLQNETHTSQNETQTPQDIVVLQSDILPSQNTAMIPQINEISTLQPRPVLQVISNSPQSDDNTLGESTSPLQSTNFQLNNMSLGLPLDISEQENITQNHNTPLNEVSLNLQTSTSGVRAKKRPRKQPPNIEYNSTNNSSNTSTNNTSNDPPHNSSNNSENNTRESSTSNPGAANNTRNDSTRNSFNFSDSHRFTDRRRKIFRNNKVFVTGNLNTSTSQNSPLVDQILSSNVNDPYNVFQFSKTARLTYSGLKRKFNALSKKLHPDKESSPGAHDAFIIMRRAYIQLKKEIQITEQLERERQNRENPQRQNTQRRDTQRGYGIKKWLKL